MATTEITEIELPSEIFNTVSAEIWKGEEVSLFVYWKRGASLGEMYTDLPRDIGGMDEPGESDKVMPGQPMCLNSLEPDRGEVFVASYWVVEDIECQNEFLRRCEKNPNVLAVVLDQYNYRDRTKLHHVREILVRKENYKVDALIEAEKHPDEWRVEDNKLIVDEGPL